MTDVADIAGRLTKAQKAALFMAPATWATASEAGMTGMAATLLCNIWRPAIMERRWCSWGSDAQACIKGGAAYEYRITPLGLAVRVHIQGNSHD